MFKLSLIYKKNGSNLMKFYSHLQNSFYYFIKKNKNKLNNKLKILKYFPLMDIQNIKSMNMIKLFQIF